MLPGAYVVADVFLRNIVLVVSSALRYARFDLMKESKKDWLTTI